MLAITPENDVVRSQSAYYSSITTITADLLRYACSAYDMLPINTLDYMACKQHICNPVRLCCADKEASVCNVLAVTQSRGSAAEVDLSASL